MTARASRQRRGKEDQSESAFSFALRSVGIVLRENAYWYIAIGALLALAIYFHYGQFGLLLRIAMAVPVIVTSCKLLNAKISLLSLKTLGVAFCCLVYVVVLTAKPPMWALGYSRAETVLVKLGFGIVVLWISVKIEGAAFFYALRGTSIVAAFQRSWSYFSGNQWWYWLIVSICIQIPVSVMDFALAPLARAYPVAASPLVFATYVLQTAFSLPYLAHIVFTSPE